MRETVKRQEQGTTELQTAEGKKNRSQQIYYEGLNLY